MAVVSTWPQYGPQRRWKKQVQAFNITPASTIVFAIYFAGSLVWVAQKEAPENGKYLGFFVSLQFSLPPEETGEREVTLEFTTSTAVVPDQFPYEECQGEDCLGDLL